MSRKPSQEAQTWYCSFCGKSQHEVQKLIAGPTVFICEECIALCSDMVNEWRVTVGKKTPVFAPEFNGYKTTASQFEQQLIEKFGNWPIF